MFSSLRSLLQGIFGFPRTFALAGILLRVEEGKDPVQQKDGSRLTG